MSYKKSIDPHSKFKLIEKLLTELKELMIVCKKNLYYIQKLWKLAQNKDVKSPSYVSSNKVWLNTKYIKTH